MSAEASGSFFMSQNPVAVHTLSSVENKRQRKQKRWLLMAQPHSQSFWEYSSFEKNVLSSLCPLVVWSKSF